MTAKSTKNSHIHQPPFWQKGLNRLRALIYRSPLYLATLRKRKNLSILDVPAFLKRPQGLNKPELNQGQFLFAGRTYQGGDQPWSVAQNDEDWQSWVHGFSWLQDLCLDHDPHAIVTARRYIRNWLDLHGVWSKQAWRADVMGERVTNWLFVAPLLTKTADQEFKDDFFNSLSLQSAHLQRSYFHDLSGYAFLKAVYGQFLSSIFLDGYQSKFDKFSNRLCGELEKQILPDGGHISRSPQLLLEVFETALVIKDIFSYLKKECPQPVHLSIDRMAPMVRTLRHGDGGLALFHGAQEDDPDEIDRLLEKSGNLGKPIYDARHSGYQRLEAGKTLILMDVGRPPEVTQNPKGHSGPLSFELSYDEERIFVNCGAVLGGDANWQAALAASAAHNMLVVNETNVAALYQNGGVKPCDFEISSKRFEENGEILIDGEHQAYKEAFGLLHQRSVYLNKTGDDIRFEDKITGTGGDSFAIFLHLHPDIQASLIQEGQAVLLKTLSGSGWHLRVQGAKVSLEESIYCNQPGETHHTQQIVLKGQLRGEGASVKWRLSKIG